MNEEKNMNKKLVVLVLTVAMTVAAIGCGKKDAPVAPVVEDTTNDTADTTDEADVPEETTDDAEAETPVEEGTFTFDAPEGFTFDEANNMWVSPNYPEEGSNINTSNSVNDGSFSSITSDILVDAVKAQFESAYGETVEITVTDEAFTEVDGVEAYYYVMSYTFQGINVEQLQYIVNGAENLYFVTYTCMNNEGYMDAFKASAETIRFE